MKGHFKILCNSLSGHSSGQDKGSRRSKPHSSPSPASEVISFPTVTTQTISLLSATHCITERNASKDIFPFPKIAFSFFFFFPFRKWQHEEKRPFCFSVSFTSFWCKLYIFLAPEKLVAAGLISSVSRVKGSSTVVDTLYEWNVFLLFGSKNFKQNQMTHFSGKAWVNSLYIYFSSHLLELLYNEISTVKYLSFQWPSNFPPLVNFTQSKGNSLFVRNPEKPDTKSRFNLHLICPKIFFNIK